MSDTITKRLYIGGLSKGVTEDEISERFSRFGKVSDLSLKSRQDEEGICTKVFAHLNIEGNEENIKKCFNTYQNTKWKGSILKLQYAKESFLTRLEKERQAEMDTKKEDLPVKAKASGGEWKSPEFTKLDGPAVPGTPIPGKKDWIVGKYGRVLPILNVKKSYKLKPVKHDPSKFCHAARIFKDDNTSTIASCDNLTWEITKPDSEITKKRKGEFPPSPPTKKAKKLTVIKPEDHFISDSFRFTGQGNRGNVEDFEVVKIGQKKKNSAEAAVPSRFDSDYEDDDADSSKINMPLNNFNSSKSPKKLQQSPKNEIQSSSQAKQKFNNLSQTDKKQNSLETKGDFPNNANQKATSTPKSNDPNNARRKVPEFAGLGMLTGMASVKTSQSQENKTVGEVTSHDNTTEKMKKPQALEKKKEFKTKSPANIKEKEKNDSKRNIPSKEAVSPKGSSCKESNGHIVPASVNEHEINIPDLSRPKSKKLIKKMEIKDMSPPSGKKHSDKKTLPATTQKSVIQEDDGNDSASSADTDEIIARCKIKHETESSTNDKKDRSVLNDSLLNKSMDLSEFSASAPEVSSNSFGNSSRVFSSIVSDSYDDSYDSDLDSNDFELVAKKLALKAASSQSSQVHTSKEKIMATETLSNSVSKVSPKVKKNDISPASKKSTEVKMKDLSPPEKTQLQSKLLEIANVTHKPNEEKTSSDKPCNKRKNKHAADNEKRLQALDEQKKMKEQQKQIVKAALENVDNACTKRIVFSSSDEDDDAEGKQPLVKPTQDASKNGAKNKEDSKKSSSKLTLLDSLSSDESDYEEMFKPKPQFEGKKGEKLMAMQRKIGDSRFQMDEKFMDSADSDDEEEEKVEKDAEEQNSLKDEKKMNLQVLENVVGKSKMDQFTAKLKKKTKHIIDMNAVRFDPTKIKPQQPEQEEMETSEEEEEMDAEPSSPQPVAKSTKSEEKTTGDKKKKKTQEQSKSSVTMSSSLVDMLKSQAKEEDSKVADDTSFSLLQQFDEDKESSDEEDIADKATTPMGHILNPTGIKSSKKMSDEDEDVNSSNDEDNLQSADESSDEDDNAQSLDKDSDEDENSQNSNEDSDEKANAQSLDEDSEEEENSQNSNEKSDEEARTRSSDGDSDEEDIADISKAVSSTETNSNKEISKDQTAQPNKKTYFTMDDMEMEKDDDGLDAKDELKSITTPYNPSAEKESALISAGRTDIRFAKKDWLERWDEIRTDLMKLCRRKHKDAGKRKRILNEKKRKKDILKNVKRKPWLKR